MKLRLFLLFLFSRAISELMAQDAVLPYREIPAYPEKYTAATVAARMVDGLGFRYYWATEGLRPEDLKFEPNEPARTTLETITHIYELSLTIINCVNKVPNVANANKPVLTFEEMRRKTLENIKASSDKLKHSEDRDLNDYKIIFKNETTTTEFPFWNQLNGPIADALWHTGQVVSFRRSSGNPFNSKVSVLTGKVRD